MYAGLLFARENHFTVDNDIEIRIIEDVCCFGVFTSQMLAQFSQVRDRLIDDNELLRCPGECTGELDPDTVAGDDFRKLSMPVEGGDASLIESR